MLLKRPLYLITGLSLVVTLATAAAPVWAAGASSGLDSVSDPLYISSANIPVITVTGATKTTSFAGPVNITDVAASGNLSVTGNTALSTLNAGNTTLGPLSAATTNLSGLSVSGNPH